MQHFNVEIEQNVAYLTIERVAKFNAFTSQMWRDFCLCLADIEASNARVLVITGDGDKAFCAGADIQELQEHINDKTFHQQNNANILTAQQQIERLNIPVIAAINGVCMGGGVGIALACDFRIATDYAKFAITPAKLGLLYSLEDCRRVVNLVGLAKAKQLLLTAKTLDAATALQWGMVDSLTTFNNLAVETEQLAQHLATLSPISLSGLKRSVNFLGGLTRGSEAELKALFDNAFEGADFVEGVAAFTEKRPPKF
ncbi:enoyl-CoA hydratase/isomerase family protein [Colwellia sp. MEBiC06753]